MRRGLLSTFVALVSVAPVPAAHADETIDGVLPDDGRDYHLVPFEVPEGIAEIEIRHPRLSTTNVLDYGLIDPQRIRGWGGGNREPIVVGELAASRSYLPGPIVAGTWNVVIGSALIEETPAYSLEILLRDTPTLAPEPERAPYTPPSLSSEARWYAGDFHVHSRNSGDASATLDEIADLAAQRGLDFVVITDHNTRSQLDFFADAQARHPDVLFVPGVEITTYAGHANGIDVVESIDHRVGEDGITIDTIAAAVAAGGGLFSINHPMLDLGNQCLGCQWRHDDLALERIDAVEIGTGAGAVLFSDDTLAFWDDLLRRGAHAAAIGGSDDHRAGQDTGTGASKIGSPTTLVYAEALSAAAITEGIRAGRTVVKLGGPEDPMVEIERQDGALRVVVTGGVDSTFVWVKNGRPMAEQTVTTDPFSHSLPITTPANGEDRYRVELSVTGLVRVVTSHVFVGPEVDEPDGCGCATSPRSGGGLEAFVLVLLALVRRPRRAAR